LHKTFKMSLIMNSYCKFCKVACKKIIQKTTCLLASKFTIYLLHQKDVVA
jgi:hypothetical protein